MNIELKSEKLSPQITLAHGNGGKLTHDLIRSMFVTAFSAEALSAEALSNDALSELADSARLKLPEGEIVFTTDSHVVNPLFFPGGDIGKLAVCGTLNDLAVMGAKPLYLSCALIIEEGFETALLKKIIDSMAEAARQNGVRIVTGDTKVVEKGAADKLFINTAGIGVVLPGAPKGLKSFQAGDAVLVSGSLGDHGIAIYAGREGISLQTDLQSDCACIFPLVEIALKICPELRIMRDPTRGGLATTLNEFVQGGRFGIELDERSLPIRDEVRGVCEILGFDPLYVANEGKLVLVLPQTSAPAVLEALKLHPLGRKAAAIGRLTERAPGRVYLKTDIGGERVLDMLVGDMLPRIC
ncbi:MAG TPA: hydrogenase expression/formation protein HypE [Bdellovibrionales bacterium]|nr:MAG: hydrogenase expression/formation protein HypE [Bdellovibrionales bacterium GWB1_52_6]OFZ02810.1 MAG: hydrogenase expression/formation protein HypE [Bdellovibrionales bacterium GWA1_52_35]OFZ39653.1 MAG: hydrogenase expression/formation protein HypE [Bdellovibrionales bacterium GWC1_52_8]HAR42533.1 hydrogenase expression/formation protein HypE [Bdellovibrionales bacterium]HCM38392.1 hydrogenase expression/formation protein HypE [Bdellovibrionales bacterium]